MRSKTETFPLGIRARLAVLVTLSTLFAIAGVTTAQTELPNPYYDGNTPDSYGSAVVLGPGQLGGLDAFISDPSYPVVQMFSRPSGGSWSWLQPFVGPADANDSFGRELALRSKNPAWNDGWALAIGSSLQDTNGSRSGAVWIASTTQGTQYFDLQFPSQLNDRFGSGLAWAGDQLVVGASGDDFYASNAGALYLYTPSYQSGGLVWGPPIRIDTSSIAAAGYAIGSSSLVASDDWLLIGANWTGGINGNDVFIYQRSGNTFVPFASQPRLNLSAADVSTLILRGDELYINGNLYSQYVRYHSGTDHWYVSGSNALFPSKIAVDDELMLGYGANGSSWTRCTSLSVLASQHLAGRWVSTGYSPSTAVVGGGGIFLRDRQLLFGSAGGRDCQGLFGPSFGTAWFFDFADDRNVNGLADAAEIISDPCLDRDANGVLDSTEGLWTGWVGTGDGSFLEELDTSRNEWNWSDGLPGGRRVSMIHPGTSPAVVTLDDSGQSHDVLGLEVEGHRSPDAELMLRLAPSSQLLVAATVCQAEMRIGPLGRILLDQAQLTGQKGTIETDGVLEIRGNTTSTVNLSSLDALPPSSRVELAGGELAVSSGIRVGLADQPADAGGHVEGFGKLSSNLVEVRASGVLEAAAGTLQVTSTSFASSGHVIVNDSDELRISASTANLGGSSEIASNGQLVLALTGSLPAQHSGEMALQGGEIDVLQSATSVLANTEDARIHGSGTIDGMVQNSGRIESIQPGDTITMGAVGPNLGELLAHNGGKLSMRSLRNDGVAQVTSGGQLETTAGGDLDNYGQLFIDDGDVAIAGDVRNLSGLTGSGLICLKDLQGAKSLAAGGAFLNDLDTRLEATDSTILAGSFANVGETILTGSTQISVTGGLTNSGQVCAKGGTHLWNGSPSSNSGTICIETGSTVFVNGSLLLPGGGVSWNCSCSLTAECGSPPIAVGATPAELTVVGDLTADQNADLDLADGKLTLLGNLDIAITDPARRKLHRGTVVLTGGVQEIEVLASDRGSSGPFGGQTKGQIGTLHVGPAPTTIRLVDRHVNDGGNEVLYVKNLVLDAGTTLDLAGRTLYYESLQQDQSANVTDSVGGGQLEQSKPAFGGAPGATLGKPGGKR